MLGFSVTYETFTRESVEAADAAERGYLLRDGTLREAIDELRELDAIDHIEPDSSPVSRAHPPRWFTAYQGSLALLYFSGDDDMGETRSLHIPERVTAASRLRIARLLGIRTR